MSLGLWSVLGDYALSLMVMQCPWDYEVSLGLRSVLVIMHNPWGLCSVLWITERPWGLWSVLGDYGVS